MDTNSTEELAGGQFIGYGIASNCATAQQNETALDCTDKPDLIEGLRLKLRKVDEQVKKRRSLQELLLLLEKNPEVARILELIKITGYC